MNASEIDRLKRLEEAFYTALERTEGDERNLFLAAIEATDPAIVHELRQLLATDSRIGASPSAGLVALPRFGSWQALKILGRGGMGTVFLAERADGAFEMRAAVKVVPLALVSSELEERFRRERRILALRNGASLGKEIPLWPGYRPCISPDTQKVAFEIFGFSGADEAAPRQVVVASLAVLPSVPIRVHQPPRLSDWAWKPDSSGLFAIGHRSLFSDSGENRLEFYALDIHNRLPEQLEYWPSEYGSAKICGISDDNRVSAVGTLGTDLRWLEFSPSLNGFKVIRSHLPRMVGCQLVNGNRLTVFADQTQRTIWRLTGDVANARFRASTATAAGIAADSSLSTSIDGKWFTWYDGKQNKLQGPDRRITPVSSTALNASISPDGSSIVYLDGLVPEHHHVLSLPTLHELRTFEVDSILWALSNNGDRALTVGVPSTPRSIAVKDTQTQLTRTVLADPARDLYLASFSPDERWILFTAERPNTKPYLYVARFDPSRMTPRSEWIEIAHGDYPKWGATSDRIYYLTESGALATVALNPRTKAPIRQLLASYTRRRLRGKRPH